MSEAPPPTASTITRRGAGLVTAAALVAAASGAAILLIAPKFLGPAGYARFAVFWALYFALLGVLFGMQQEATRSASAASAVDPPGESRVRIVRTCLLIGLVGAFAIGATAPLWAPVVFTEYQGTLALVIVAAVVLYAGQSGLVGVLAGRRRWGAVAAITATEATVRIIAVGIAAVAGWGLLGLSVGTGVAAVAWLGVLVVSPTVRAALRTRGDTGTRAFTRRSGHAMLAAAASAVLVMGFPAVLEVTTSGELGAEGGRLVLAILLTRAPLMVPMNAFQGVAINHFVAHRARGIGGLARPLFILVGVGATGAGLAWLAGDPVIAALFGEEYRNPPCVLAALTGAATLVAVLALTGAAVLAADRHRPYVAGWVAATTTATALLLLPGSLTTRALVSLAIGPLVGIVVHLVALAGGPVSGRARTPQELPASPPAGTDGAR